MRALPLKHPAHALRCPSQSGDLKVKCPSNRTLNVNGPLIIRSLLFTRYSLLAAYGLSFLRFSLITAAALYLMLAT